MSTTETPHVLELAHSPDPDDAFMWWPLFQIDDRPPRIDTGQFQFVPVMEDIETLNERSERGVYAITAMSCAQYPRVRERYAITSCGASMGDRYGPKLIARDPIARHEIVDRQLRVAIPGERTSAFAVLNMMLGAGRFQYDTVPFKVIIDRVSDSTFDVGLVIHEGQLTYREAGMHLIDDIGAWWHDETGLPLPLGVNAIRRDLEDLFPGALEEVTRLLMESVVYALAHRAESVAWAMKFARGMTADRADEFIDLYVNAWTLDFGPRGHEAVRTFLEKAHAAGLVPDPGTITFVQPRQEVGG